MFKSKQIIDPILGQIRYRKPLFHFGFWQGRIKFAPIESNIDIYIFAGKDGIFPAQREFYQELERNFSMISKDICSKLQDFMFSCHDDEYFVGLTQQEVWGQFRLERLLITDPNDKDALWELSFNYEPLNQSYTVYFDQWKPVQVRYDD